MLKARVYLSAAIAVFLATFFISDRASAFPDRPLTLVVPFAAGGPADLIARRLADAMGQKLGQKVIVENIPGAGGTTGSSRVARAAPDGYTMLLGHIGTHGAAPALYTKLPYDPIADFFPVGLVGTTPMVLLTKNTVGSDGLRAFREYVKTRGDKLTFSHGGIGSISHLGCTLLNRELGIEATPIGYRGNGPALVDLLAGHVDYMCDAVSTARPHIAAGAVRAVMLLSNPVNLNPLPAPTAKTSNVAIDMEAWYVLFLPKNADPKARAKIHEALDYALDLPSLKDGLGATGTTTSLKEQRNQAFVEQMLKKEVSKWKQVLKPIE